MNTADPIAPLREFVVAMTRLVESAPPEADLLGRGRELLATLIADDAWLPDEFAQPDPRWYCQYLLHCDPLERFSVVSFVWGPGQRTPIHDHTVWGLVGVMRGREREQPYAHSAQGRLEPSGDWVDAARGHVGAVSPSIGDVHVVANALDDAPSISIHVYGANIGAVRRNVYDAASGEAKAFVSGYSSPRTPNLWDRSAALRAPSR